MTTETIQGICKDCGNGTLNNELNPAFEPNFDESGEYGTSLICVDCGSTHLDLVLPIAP